MKDINIVEYDHKYAEAIAEMWNRSSENWGGYDTKTTARDVIEEHENSINLNIFLALNGEEVIGYCSFSEYKEDEGALYIPLLNVRPDYHGKKVGKALVLKAVDRAVELAWPRLDLYTWPGNTKAVPLYKKCGFFWEKRDDSTHLMNFLPTVLHTEAIKDYFNNLDWYQDSKRVIEVKPDGMKEDDYSHYQYYWEKDGEELRMEFERKGRGLRLIETNDYLISASVDEQELVFGKEYQVAYEIINKSGEDLDIYIKGINDKNIKFPFEISTKVENSKKISGNFYLGEIEEEQSHWRTHPTVSAEVMINGKKAEFKVGIVPKFPVNLSLIVPEKEIFQGIESVCYLDIENGYNEVIDLEFEMPDSGNIKFTDKKVCVKLEPKEKSSLAVGYILQDYEFYSAEIPVRIKLQDEEFDFVKKLTAAFRGRIARFGGETKNNWLICNGNYQVTLSKFNNEIKIKNFKESKDRVYFMYPRFGLPFTMEFSKKRPEQIEFINEADIIGIKARYLSKDFKELQFISVIKLHSDGMVENYYEVINSGEAETNQEIWISQSIFYALVDALLPTEDGLIRVKGTDSMFIENWDLTKVSENWLFCQENVTRGLVWPKDSQLKSHEWHLSIDSNLGKVVAGTKVKTDPVFIALDVYSDWEEFRAFALKEDYPGNIQLRDKLDIEVNGGNSFVDDEYKVKLRGYKKANLSGKIEINSGKEAFKQITNLFSAEDNLKESETTIKCNNEIARDELVFKVDLDSQSFTRKAVVFNVQKEKNISNNIITEKSLKVFTVDNGLIKIKAAPEFSPSLYSINYQDREWLDSSFPEAGPKSWWSPWSGGIVCRPENLKNVSIQEASREADFVEVRDNYNNLWQGIKIGLKIEENKDCKGLEIDQCFLLLPGLPLLLFAAEIIQNTGYHFDNREFITEVFLKTDKFLKDSNFVFKDKDGEFIKYKSGRVEYEVESDSAILFGGNNRREGLQIYQTGSGPIWGITNIDVLGGFISNKVSIQDRKRVFLPATFFLFTDNYLEDITLGDLKNIRLKR